MCAVPGEIFFWMLDWKLASQSATFSGAAVRGRVSLMFWYLARPGRRWM